MRCPTRTSSLRESYERMGSTVGRSPTAVSRSVRRVSAKFQYSFNPSSNRLREISESDGDGLDGEVVREAQAEERNSARTNETTTHAQRAVVRGAARAVGRHGWNGTGQMSVAKQEKQ